MGRWLFSPAQSTGSLYRQTPCVRQSDCRSTIWAAGEKPPESLKVFCIITKAAIPHDCARFAVLPGFGVAQPDPSRLSKVRGQHHIQQTSLPVSPDLRNAGYRVRKAVPRLPLSQLTAAHRYQHALIARQKARDRGWSSLVCNTSTFTGAGAAMTEAERNIAGIINAAERCMTHSFIHGLHKG